MENKSPTLRFGITAGGKRSSYWRVRAGMAKPELFMEREDYGKKWHLSLHASGQWHMEESGKERFTWNRPPEVVPGYTRAVAIVEPVVVAHREDPPPEGVALVQVATDAEPTVFSVFLERPGANLSGWPGKNADGSTFVGRIPLAVGAGTCCIVGVQAPLAPSKLVGRPPSEDEHRQIREWTINRVLVATVMGQMSDGAIALIDLRGDPSVAATLDKALS